MSRLGLFAKPLKACAQRGLQWGVVCGFVSAILSLLIIWTGASTGVEMRLLDWRQRATPAVFSPRIAIVGFDDKGIRHLSPYPREILAAVIRKLHADGARVIVLDVLLKARRPAEEQWEDLELAAAMVEAGNVVLPIAFDETNRLVEPIPFFQSLAVGTGYAHADLSPSDGIVRWIRPVLLPPDAPRALTSMVQVAKEVAEGHHKEPRSFTSYADVARQLGLPLDPKGKMYISYAPEETLRKYPAQALLAGDLPPEWFRGRIVFVGAMSPELGDMHRVPQTSAASQDDPARLGSPGVFIQAQALSTLLARHPLRDLDPRWQFVIIAVLAVATGCLFVMSSPIVGMLACGVLVYAVAEAGMFAFRQHGLVVALAPLISSVGLSYVLAICLRYFVIERSARRTRRTFARYLHPRVVDEILANSGPCALGQTQRRRVTILFSDVRDYTGLTADMTPEETVGILNEYFTLVSPEVLNREGFIADYVGDGMLAVFGLFSADSVGAWEATEAAWAMQEAVRRNREGGGHLQFAIGIGIHTGEVVAGNMGSPQRTDYAVVGPSVNLASRVEGLTKSLGAPILMTQETFDLVAERVTAVDRGEHEMRGFESRKFRLHEILDLRRDEAQ